MKGPNKNARKGKCEPNMVWPKNSNSDIIIYFKNGYNIFTR